MGDIDLHKQYNSSGECVQDLFDSTEEGFFVPLYQREYTWEEDNINQLFDDLVLGTHELSDSEEEKATIFFGTVITTSLEDKKQTVRPGEERAQPTGVEIVIDGQQRISTLSLISVQITAKLQLFLQDLPGDITYRDLADASEKYIERLARMHTIQLGKGATPPLKPKIIRAQEDKWTYDGEDTSYRSPIARYIATFIRTKNAQQALDSISAENAARVRGNSKLIDNWLEAVCEAHVSGTRLHNQFPVGPSITSDRIQEYVLGFTDPGVGEMVERMETDRTHIDYRATAIYQLLLLTYFLLRRCGVNRLQPTHQDWGFDMFQALNTTGTPLTVMETFVPAVMQAELSAGNNWSETPSCKLMDEVQDLFEATTSNEQKNRRTNELTRSLALCYEGTKLGNKFSEQRRWMTLVYEKQMSTIQDKREFMRKLARTANFFYFGWYMEEPSAPNHVKGLQDHREGDLVALLIRYLRDANSMLSAPILARFYSQAVDEKSSFEEFVECAKACAAFFTLWRSANSTSGLDEIYRRFFKGSNSPIPVDNHSWSEHPQPLKSRDLKQYFWKVMENGGIATREGWTTASERFLLYTELKTICRFILFVAGEDRVADDANPGLTAPGTIGTCPLLKLERWKASDFRTLEHVAPQNPNSGHSWDPDIYDSSLVHQVGNLLLLPIELNKHVDNKAWAVKHIHYCHIGERDQDKLKKLRQEATKSGINLSKKAIAAFSSVRYNCTVEPILSVGKEGLWEASLIMRRTEQIKTIAWDTLSSWLRP